MKITVTEERYKVKVDEEVTKIKTDEKTTSAVEVGVPGPQGPKGEPGPVTATYVHEQSTPSKEWEIKHDLDKYPSVTVVDSSHRVVVGDIEYQDKNKLIVTFKSEFAGKAFLN